MRIHLQRTPATALPPDASPETARRNPLQAAWRCLSTAGRLSSLSSLLRHLPPGGASPTARRHTSKDTPLLVYTLAQSFMHIQLLNLTSRSLATNVYNTTNHQLIQLTSIQSK